MGNLDKNGTVTISECPKVIVPIEARMWRMLEEINHSKELSRKLFGIEFLATTSGECLVTMLYHRKLEETWEKAASRLETELDISLIGRSRKQKVVCSKTYVTEKLTVDEEVYVYRHYEGGFTQPNPVVNVKMIEWVLSRIEGDQRVDLLESYCGLGNFTIPLSKKFTKVLATEISKNSIRAAKENCLLNHVNHIEFVRLSSEEMTQALNKQRLFRRLEGIDLERYDFSHVLVDPPRAGLDEDTIKLISSIDTILYISCNPETLARDLEMLSETHTVTDAALFDQFPHTTHVESGVILRRKV
jgi:tRNA (uracil-5-)-methyltransferase